MMSTNVAKKQRHTVENDMKQLKAANRHIVGTEISEYLAFQLEHYESIISSSECLIISAVLTVSSLPLHSYTL